MTAVVPERRPDQRSDLEAMAFSAEHLLCLLNDVLDLSKLEADRIEIEQIDFSLENLIRGLRASFAQRVREKGIGFEVEVAGAVPNWLTGDPSRLLQVLTNLVGNAVKFTDAGKVSLQVSVGEALPAVVPEEESAGEGTPGDARSGVGPAETGPPEGGATEIAPSADVLPLHFVVEDTGVGIQAEQLERLFQEFSQASVSTGQTHGGSGLGLVISKGLVERMGGSLEVESRPGMGSRFALLLPWRRGASLQPAEIPSEGGRPSLQGARVLLAEDNSLNIKVAKRFLERWGCAVTVAEDGVLAIEHLEREFYDIVLLDLHMPRMGGIEVARWVRSSADPRLRFLPLLALTAATTSEERRAVEDAGMNGFVPKPFAPAELESALVRSLAPRGRSPGRESSAA